MHCLCGEHKSHSVQRLPVAMQRGNAASDSGTHASGVVFSYPVCMLFIGILDSRWENSIHDCAISTIVFLQ